MNGDTFLINQILVLYRPGHSPGRYSIGIDFIHTFLVVIWYTLSSIIHQHVFLSLLSW